MKNIFHLFFSSYPAACMRRSATQFRVIMTKVERPPADTVFYFSSRVDTLAIFPTKTDTAKMVEDKNAQDLKDSKYKIKVMGA